MSRSLGATRGWVCDPAWRPRWTVRRFRRGAHDLVTTGGVAVLVASLTGACVKQLPAAATPAPVVPATQAPPLLAGQGRLVVDVTDGPMPVQRVDVGAEPRTDAAGRVSYQLVEARLPLCPSSPCVVDLPPGNIALGFPVLGDRRALEVELVNIGPDVSVYRRTLAVYEDHTGALRTVGIVGTAVGAVAAITGVSLLSPGLAKDNDGLATAGGITLGVGAAVLAFGIWAIRRDAPTFRPGAAIHFSP